MTQYLCVLIILALTHVFGHCSLGDSFPSYRNCVLECTEKRCDKGDVTETIDKRCCHLLTQVI